MMQRFIYIRKTKPICIYDIQVWWKNIGFQKEKKKTFVMLKWTIKLFAIVVILPYIQQHIQS